MHLEEIPRSRLVVEPVTVLDSGQKSQRRRTDGEKAKPIEPQPWVNFTHPSQMKDNTTRYRVKSFISRTRKLSKMTKRRADAAEDEFEVVEEQITESWLDGELQLSLEDENPSMDHNSGPKPLAQVLKRSTSGAPWPLYRESDIGKLRVECIESYPARETPRLSRALEFYMSSMGPTGIWRPDILDAGATSVFKRKFFQFSVFRPAVTEVIMAIAQVHIQQFVSPGSGIEASQAVLKHRGKALKGLRKELTLSTPESEDAVLILILSLLILDSNFEDWTSYEANLKGLRQFIKLRGGIECLGWYGWAAWMVMWAELRWAGHLTQLAIAQSAIYGLRSMTYPERPFSGEICLDISHLPEGFRELAISQSLSDEVIRHLRHVSQWSHGFRFCILASGDLKDFSLQEMKLANHTHMILETCDLKPTERLIFTGVLAYIISFDPNVPLERHPQYLKDHTSRLEQLLSDLPAAEQTSDVLVWVATCIAAINTKIVEIPAKEQWFLMDLVLDRSCCCDDFDEVWGAARNAFSKFLHDEFIELEWKKRWRAEWEKKESLWAALLGP